MADNADGANPRKEGSEPAAAPDRRRQEREKASAEAKSAGIALRRGGFVVVTLALVLAVVWSMGLLPFAKDTIDVCARAGFVARESADCAWEIYPGAVDEDGCELRGGAWTVYAKRTPTDGIEHKWVCRAK